MTGKFEGLERLARLRDSGVLTEDEFQSEKAKLLGGSEPTDSAPVVHPTSEGRTGPNTVIIILVITGLLIAFAGILTIIGTDNSNPPARSANTTVLAKETPESPPAATLSESPGSEQENASVETQVTAATLPLDAAEPHRHLSRADRLLLSDFNECVGDRSEDNRDPSMLNEASAIEDTRNRCFNGLAAQCVDDHSSYLDSDSRRNREIRNCVRHLESVISN